jgi:hypothetical protein
MAPQGLHTGHITRLMEQVKSLSEELGYPSADKLWAEVRKRSIHTGY